MSLIAQSNEITFKPATGAALALLVVIWAVVLVVMIVAYVKIITKAGYSGWWILIGFVPIANVVFFLIFAFSDWPVLQENRRLRTGTGIRTHGPAELLQPPQSPGVGGGTPPPPPPPPSS